MSHYLPNHIFKLTVTISAYSADTCSFLHTPKHEKAFCISVMIYELVYDTEVAK